MTRIFHWFLMWKINPMSGCDIRLVFTLPPRDGTLQYKRCVHFWNNFPCITSLTKPKLFLNYANFLTFKPCACRKCFFFQRIIAYFCGSLRTERVVIFLMKILLFVRNWWPVGDFLTSLCFWVFEFLKYQLKFYLYNENYNYWFNIMSLNVDKKPILLEWKNILKNFFQSKNALEFS